MRKKKTAAALGGAARMAQLSPEERRELARLGALAGWAGKTAAEKSAEMSRRRLLGLKRRGN